MKENTKAKTKIQILLNRNNIITTTNKNARYFMVSLPSSSLFQDFLFHKVLVLFILKRKYSFDFYFRDGIVIALGDNHWMCFLCMLHMEMFRK